MTEEKQKKEEEKEQEVENKSTMIDKANIAAARLEAANKKQEELLARQEALRVEETLGGKADAGTPIPTEETDADYAKKVMSNEIESKNE